jgi:hypothetical protein
VSRKVWVPAVRNYNGIQYQNLRVDVDPRFNELHDELSDAYYNYWKWGESKDFQGYDVQPTIEESKEQFDALHGLIHDLHMLNMYARNESLANLYPSLKTRMEALREGKTRLEKLQTVIKEKKDRGFVVKVIE